MFASHLWQKKGSYQLLLNLKGAPALSKFPPAVKSSLSDYKRQFCRLKTKLPITMQVKWQNMFCIYLSRTVQHNTPHHRLYSEMQVMSSWFAFGFLFVGNKSIKDIAGQSASHVSFHIFPLCLCLWQKLSPLFGNTWKESHIDRTRFILSQKSKRGFGSCSLKWLGIVLFVLTISKLRLDFLETLVNRARARVRARKQRGI